MHTQIDHTRVCLLPLVFQHESSCKPFMTFVWVCYLWRLRDELVGNYYSDDTLERLAVHLGLLKDYLRFLAGDLSHSRSICQSVWTVCPLYFLGLRFHLIYPCKLIVECPFLVVSCCCIRWGICFHIFLAPSKGGFLVVFRIWHSTVWILGIFS